MRSNSCNHCGWRNSQSRTFHCIKNQFDHGDKQQQKGCEIYVGQQIITNNYKLNHEQIIKLWDEFSPYIFSLIDLDNIYIAYKIADM